MEQGNSRKFIEYNLPDDSAQDKIETDFRLYQQGIKDAPDNPDNYFHLATIFITRGKVAEAIPMLEQCLRRNPEHMEAYFLLGNCYIRHDQFEISARYYLKVLKLNSSHIPALYNIGLCYAELGMQKKAISAFKKFYALEGSNQWREEAKYQLHKLGVSV